MRPPALLPLVLLVMALASCGPSRRRWQPVEGTHEGPATFVVLPYTTPLHTAPSERAPTVRLVANGRATPFLGRRLAVLRILRERGGWAELETPGPLDDGHCAGELGPLRALRLRVFAPASALVPVTTRAVSQTFADDTAITLERGVPVEPLPGTSLYRARLGALDAVVRLGVADSGTRYLTPPRHGPDGRPPPVGHLSPRAFAVGGPILGQTGRVSMEDAQIAVPYYVARDRGPTESLVELRPRCAVLTVRVAREHLEGGALADLIGMSLPDSIALVGPGETVYWSDGREAGVTALELPLTDERAERDGHRCFAHRLRADDADDAAVELCFDASAVRAAGGGLGRQLSRP